MGPGTCSCFLSGMMRIVWGCHAGAWRLRAVIGAERRLGSAPNTFLLRFFNNGEHINKKEPAAISETATA